MEKFHYGEARLTVGLALEIEQGQRQGIIGPAAREKVLRSYEAVQNIVNSEKVVYGINTGFGSLCTTIISKEDTQKLQYNILRSHSVGVGEPVPLSVARLMMIQKLHSLCQGYSGVALSTLERIIWHIDHNITPLVPIQGSVGASGDLAPLAHLFLPLIGLGKVWYKGQYVETVEMMQAENIQPIELGAKEGLALINGTQFITAYAIKATERLLNCLDAADIIGAMSLEGMLGSVKPFDEHLHQLRAYDGSQHVAHRLRNLLSDSEMIASHKDCGRVQDPYSLRCMPQVHGASRNSWLHLKEMLENELNAVTDNPIIFSEEKTISGGNFHGQLLALPLDYATLGASELGNISDRRVYLLLEGSIVGLPTLLMKNTGINSGFMIPQYTSAALASENKSLCFPASADSIPTSLGQEDHVSMGSISGRKTNQVIDNLEYILAVELLCAAQAFDFRKPLKSSVVLDGCHQLIRQHIDHAEEDRIFANDIEKTHEIIVSKQLVKHAHQLAIDNHINLKGEHHELFGLY
ncbi:histidine ammonia-lyase [Rapidithrix thailandica]|uniref:Histidine ammonia-lyase n=1 Tax=Rapidithrix thailandica TaxID=413964 RepID=A0AAW9SA54_9BACT